MSVRSARWILALALALGGLPFVNQAFHIDDRIYLEVARHAIENPLFPYDYPATFEGLGAPDAASHSHLPLTSYYLAVVQLATGSPREWICHLAFLIFPLIALWSFYDLAQRWLRLPLVASLLLLVSPTFLALSHTLMTEVPLLAFWLLAISRFLRVAEGKGGPSDHFLCAVGLFGASMISLLSGGLVLLLAAHLFIRRRRGAPVRWAPLLLLLALPVAVWVLWYGAGYFHYGRFLLIRTALHMEKRDSFSEGLMLAKAASFVLDIGGAALFPVAVWYGFANRRATFLFGAVLVACLAGVFGYAEGWTAPQGVLLALCGAAGAVAMTRFLGHCGSLLRGGREDVRIPDPTILAWLALLWLAGIFVSCVILYPSGSTRYTLLAVPPFLLVWQSSLETCFRSQPRVQRNLAWLAVLLTAGWSLAVSHGDYRFAGVYRDEAKAIVADYQAPGRTIWFTAEWGFRYYLEKSGARMLTRSAVGPKPGDILVKPYLASPWVTLYDGDKNIRLLKQIDAKVATPIRILDYSSHAGFYSTAWGILPFSVTGGERWEWFNVFQVTKEYDGPIPEPELHW